MEKYKATSKEDSRTVVNKDIDPLCDSLFQRIHFPTQYSKNTKCIFSQCGRPEIDTYDYTFDNNKKELQKVGTKNIYDRIQAEADLVDINKLMLRFKETGDASIFDRVHGAYFDATGLPDTLAGMYERINVAENYFNSLPIEVKEAFNNSPVEFFDSYGSDEFNYKLNSLYPDEVIPSVESEVIEHGSPDNE